VQSRLSMILTAKVGLEGSMQLKIRNSLCTTIQTAFFGQVSMIKKSAPSRFLKATAWNCTKMTELCRPTKNWNYTGSLGMTLNTQRGVLILKNMTGTKRPARRSSIALIKEGSLRVTGRATPQRSPSTSSTLLVCILLQREPRRKVCLTI